MTCMCVCSKLARCTLFCFVGTNNWDDKRKCRQHYFYFYGYFENMWKENNFLCDKNFDKWEAQAKEKSKAVATCKSKSKMKFTSYSLKQDKLKPCYFYII